MPAETPSYEELAVVVRRQAERIAELEAEVAELRARVGQNPRNSSRPPSSEGLGKPAPKSQRRRSGRRPGGQNGHPGSTLAQVADPDEVVRHEPVGCAGCGGGLAEAAGVGVERRQVFDLPPIRVQVTEHQLVVRRCGGCGTATRAAAPDGVDAPACYGPRVAAIVVYLYVGQFLSRKRAAAALAELFGTPVCGGTVTAMTARAAARLGAFTALTRDRIAAADVAHFDETGLRVDGRLRWVHSASTGKYSLITVHDKRGVAAMDAAGVLPAFTGIACHDAWAPYDTYDRAIHALCNAHLLRELQAVADQTPEGQWCWAAQAADALRAMKHLRDAAVHAGDTSADAEALAQHIHAFRSAVTIGQTQTRARSNPLMRKHHALARRLADRQADYLRFTTDFRVPFDNNAAERDIRMIKLRQKVSGCLRTRSGAEQFCAIRSYLATAAKHGICFFQALVQLAEGHPWLPETA